MTPATRDDVIELLGEVDDLVVERVVATGASVGEIGEALDSLEGEYRSGEGRVELSPRVIEVRAILADVVENDLDEDRVYA
jgi:hypothetical protein